MKHLFLFLILTLTAACPARAQDDFMPEGATHVVRLETTMGHVRLALYDDTPLHRDQFLSLVGRGYYDGLLLHRVVPNFVVQGGDSLSRTAKAGDKLGDAPEPYSLPAEIHFPRHYHKSGALAAARESDDVNPERASSYSQFYIVCANPQTDDRLDQAQHYLDSVTCGAVRLTPEIKETYRSLGGLPHLDGLYTVFGEVIEGMDVVDQISWAGRDEHNRPFEDIRIVRASLEAKE